MPEPTEEKTFIDFLRKFDPNEVSPDGKLTTNRIHQGSKHYKLWKAAGGKVTDEEELVRWPGVTDQRTLLMQSDSILTIVDPSNSILDKYNEVIK